MSNSCIWPIDRTLIRCYHSGPEWTWEWWQGRGTLHSPLRQHYWSLTIRLFCVIYRTLDEEYNPSAEMYSAHSTAPDDNLNDLLPIHSYFNTFSIYLLIGKKCPWCNGYRRRKWIRRHEFKPWTRLIAFHIALIPWERYESNYSPSNNG